jgi:hypothetical protein
MRSLLIFLHFCRWLIAFVVSCSQVPSGAKLVRYVIVVGRLHGSGG